MLPSVRSILVQMVSAAGTGYFFNTKRSRLRDKLVLRKHDPFGKMHVYDMGYGLLDKWTSTW